jgi:hypothetical protein
MLCSTQRIISVDCGQSLACMEELGDKFKVVLAGKLLESAGKQGRGGGVTGKILDSTGQRDSMGDSSANPARQW